MGNSCCINPEDQKHENIPTKAKDPNAINSLLNESLYNCNLNDTT